MLGGKRIYWTHVLGAGSFMFGELYGVGLALPNPLFLAPDK